MELTIQRRHSAKCPDKAKGPHHLKCRGKRPCPLWVFGYDTNGVRVRESLGTRDVARAAGKLKELIDRIEHRPAYPRKTVAAAIEAFYARHSHLGPETLRKYRRHVSELASFLVDRGIVHCDQFKLDLFDAYVVAR